MTDERQFILRRKTDYIHATHDHLQLAQFEILQYKDEQEEVIAIFFAQKKEAAVIKILMSILTNLLTPDPIMGFLEQSIVH